MSGNANVENVVIVGGGTAGWLTAAIIAAKHKNTNITITLIESPNVKTIGVGEGTWPSLRQTLAQIGISETTFLLSCDASFKQASKFVGWHEEHTHSPQSTYYHPFSLPDAQFNPEDFNLFCETASQHKLSFAKSFCNQYLLCEQNLAPKQIGTQEYGFVSNYGYHLDAGKFANLLKSHCVEQLCVIHKEAHVNGVISDKYDHISALNVDHGEQIKGDLFIDCSGQQALLINKHYGIDLHNLKSVLFNDSALTVQIPHQENQQTLSSNTIATAQDVGWIWDIGLPSRRGVGYVYSSDYISEKCANTALKKYIGTHADNIVFKKLNFTPGHRKTFWHKNCIAIGMSAGFIEPLEASAIALIEQSAHFVARQLPKNNQCMAIIAKRFNQKMQVNWQQIIEFLKLHYVLSPKQHLPYWRDNREPASIPSSLKEKLLLWRFQPPSKDDIPYTEPMFPLASYQYVLAGMKFMPNPKSDSLSWMKNYVKALSKVQEKQQKLASVLTNNRKLIQKVSQYGFPKI